MLPRSLRSEDSVSLPVDGSVSSLGAASVAEEPSSAAGLDSLPQPARARAATAAKAVSARLMDLPVSVVGRLYRLTGRDRDLRECVGATTCPFGGPLLDTSSGQG